MEKRPFLVVLTGAGISAESGLKTFRDAGGLWENHNVMDVASIQGWKRNPELVHQFYDERRKQAWIAEPNEGHRTLVRLETHFDVTIVTQNVDLLHEKAGSKNVLHLHGSLHRAKCSSGEEAPRNIEDKTLPYGQKCGEKGIWRPDIVWFGEEVPNMLPAIEFVEKADILLIIGTSLQVYPAAGLLAHARYDAEIWLADPNAHEIAVNHPRVKIVAENAGTALPFIEKELLKHYFNIS